MSKCIPTVIALCLALALPASVLGQGRDEIELTRQIIQTERQAIVANALQLTDAQAKAFWPLFRQYHSELSTSGDRLVNLIEGYAKSYNSDSITDDKAASMLTEWLSISDAKLKTQKKWVKKFNGVLPPTKVVLLYQVENKLDSIIDLELAAEIPLIP